MIRQSITASLTVKDLQVSKEFYEKLGFEVFGGNEEYNYFIMKNGETNIGSFQGMFNKNMRLRIRKE